MAKNINLQNMTIDTLNILSAWNYAFVNGQELRKLAKSKVDEAQKAVDKVNDARQACIDAGMSLDEAISKNSRVEADNALSKAEGEYKDLCGDLRDKSNRAKKLVPDTLFDAYKDRVQKKKDYVKAIATFLGEMGIAGTDRATEKVADALVEWLPTAKKAVGKQKTAGHKVQDVSKMNYQDMFIAAFLEYAINVKGCLDQAEDGTLTFHVFEEAPKAEAEAEAPKAE